MTRTVAVVTGASRNLGAATAAKLAEDGFAVAINYYQHEAEDEVAQLVGKIEATGGRAKGYLFDVSDEAAVLSSFERIRSELGPIQVLVNNAAASVASSIKIDEIEVADWDAVTATNLRGMFLCSKSALVDMKKMRDGSIINISSIRTILGMEGNIHYTTTKAGQIGFSRVLAREVGDFNIRVNSILCGGIKTPDESVYGDQDALDARMIGFQSLPRRGMPTDVANAVSYFASPLSSFVTGQSLVVDGGWVMD